MPATTGRRIIGGLPKRHEEYSVDAAYKVGNKPFKIGAEILPPGAYIPPEAIYAIPRLESFIRQRRIVPA